MGKKILENKLNAILDVNFITIDHFAGIRPATKDRRPFIGTHPEFKNIGIFNGLGSKGAYWCIFCEKVRGFIGKGH